VYDGEDMYLPEETLKELLVDGKIITPDVFEQAVVHARETGSTIEQALREKDIVPDGQLGEIVARYFKLPAVVVNKMTIPEEVLNIVPEDTARQYKVIAYERTPELVRLATGDPTNAMVPKLVSQKTGLKVELAYATDWDIESSLTNYSTNFQDVFEKLLNEENKVMTTIVNDPPVKKMVEVIVEAAFKEKASDIHIEPQEADFIVRFRIDGLLRDIVVLPKRIHERVVTRIKVLANLRTDQHFAAQDGKFKVEFPEHRLDLRVSIIPVADGEKVVMRLLSSQVKSFSLTDVGFSDVDLQKLRDASKRSFGMILVTGPTGSGKTTTIYSVLKTINTREHNLTSIEDPIEYQIKGANQVQVNEKTGLTFANGLRSLLRQDPDYIFVGEVRDGETASIAINAALTGHLVFSTLHTNSAAASLPRLFDMKVEPFLVASTVSLIIAQRLVRRICPHCRVSETVTAKDLEQYFSPEVIAKHYIPVGENKEIRLYKGAGCRVCHGSGYLGRIGIYEVMAMSKTLRELTSAKADADTINAKALEEGMTSMFDDGVTKISRGMTTIEELLRVTTTQGD
jgi:type IV pilus assembly protein PilB